MLVASLGIIMALSALGVIYCTFSRKIDDEASAMICLSLECVFFACLILLIAYIYI